MQRPADQKFGLSLLVCLVLFLVSTQANAGVFDNLTDSLKKAGDNISKSVQDVSKKVGLTPKKEPAKARRVKSKPASKTLPGGVTHRLNKINAELEKAETLLADTSQSEKSRKRGAQRHVKKAQRYKTEIENQYKGKYDPGNAHLDLTYKRLARLRITVSGETQALVGPKPAQPVSVSAEPVAAKAVPAAPKISCEQWTGKFQVFTQGDKPLHVYATNDDALMTKWKGYYDEAVVLKEELDETPLGQSPCSRLKGELSLLARYMENFEAIYTNYSKKQEKALANMGQMVFSKSPINPKNPSNLTTLFDAGDHIYGLIRTTKSLAKIFKNKNSGSVRVDVSLDGKKIHAQFIQIKNPKYMQQRYLSFEIAPDPDKMKAYSDPGLIWGKSTPVVRQGPNELSQHLSKLTAGKHTMAFKFAHYGNTYATGTFDISGSSYKAYADMHRRIAVSLAGSVTLPPAKKVDKALEAEMKKLVKNAGWPKVYRLSIVDKDWWIDRTSGGNSPVKSRHMAAAIMACGTDGQYYYKTCIFHQDRLITGGFGKLYISHQGQKVPITKANIDK